MEEEINDIIDNDIVQKYIDIASIKFSKKARYTVKNVSVNIEKLFNIIKLSNDIPVIRRLNTLKVLRDFNYKHYRKFIFNDANQLKSLKFNIQVVVESGGIYSKARYSAYHRNFKNSEPLVVNFHEVKPVEVVRIEWEMC